jgi:hypothetical protein
VKTSDPYQFKRMQKPKKPSEPDLTTARNEFEETHQLTFIYKVEILRNHVMKKIEKIINELKSFVETIGSMNKVRENPSLITKFSNVFISISRCSKHH